MGGMIYGHTEMATHDDDFLVPAGNITVAPETLAEIRRLYHEAFRLYGAMALWNVREFDAPTAEQALNITRQLRIEGNMSSRRHAEKLEALCRAA